VSIAAAVLVALTAIGFSLAEEEGASAVGARLAVTFVDGHRVDLLALDGSRVASIPTGLSPRGMAVHEERLYVANRGTDEAPGSSLTVVDLESLRPERTVYACLACAPYDLLFDPEGHLWFTGQADRTVYRMLPPYDGPESSIMVSWGWPTELALVEGMGTLAVAMRDSQDLALIDTRTNRAQRVTIATAPGAVAGRPGRPEAWAAVDPLGQLARVEVRGDAGRPQADLKKIENYAAALGFLPGGQRLLVSVGQPMGVALYRADGPERLDRIETTARPGAIAVAPSGERAAVLVPAESKVLILGIDGDGLVEQASIPVEGRPARVLWLP
jgi:DNA-binding beta-propeller fold protein YncE